jgi:hypothetical protein
MDMKTIKFIIALLLASPAFATAPIDMTATFAAAKPNSVIMCPKGQDLLVSGPIIYQAGQDHITIDGNGARLHIAVLGTSTFKTAGCTGFTIRNFSLIDQQDKSKPRAVLVYDTGKHTTISGNNIVGLLKVLDCEWGADAPQVVGNTISETGSVSVYITANNCYIAGNNFSHSIGEYLLRFEPPSDNNGQLLHNPDGSIVRVTSGQVVNNKFTNHNQFYKDAVGIRMGDNILFHGNEVDGSIRLGQSPATLGSACNGLILTENTFTHPNGDDARYVGTLLVYSGVGSTIISGNVFQWNQQSPIAVAVNSAVAVTKNVQQIQAGEKAARLVGMSSQGWYGGGPLHNEIDPSNVVVVTKQKHE